MALTADQLEGRLNSLDEKLSMRITRTSTQKEFERKVLELEQKVELLEGEKQNLIDSIGSCNQSIEELVQRILVLEGA